MNQLIGKRVRRDVRAGAHLRWTARVGIVIPALNESATILNVVETAGIYGVPIVVDDGSTDDTAELAKQAGAVVVTHERNRGYDAALNTGFKKAAELGSEVIISLDAEGQHDPSLLQRFIDKTDAGAEVVVGIRSRRQGSSFYFYEPEDADKVRISEDNHRSYSVTLGIDKLSIFMSHKSFHEFMTILNFSFDAYMKGPNYGKKLAALEEHHEMLSI